MFLLKSMQITSGLHEIQIHVNYRGYAGTFVQLKYKVKWRAFLKSFPYLCVILCACELLSTIYL